MPKMTQEDDPEAYIEAFERHAIMSELDKGYWASQLGTLIVDKAQAIYWALPRDEAHDYDQRNHRANPVKVACLHGETKQIDQQWIQLQVMEHQGDLLVDIVPRLECNMLLGWDWTPIYDMLERVWDAEVKRRKIRSREGWLGELEESEGSMNKANEIDFRGVEAA
ncbi:hypothetical protein Y1Q_0018183 [Alligator mississippiensis]|uniref:Uncharacterized protein n=1 Tax=Alligator mississippiensis TaxID=8496 RepID=A0A151NFH7_ALLMI|nr:hypothetical protein Y1Q_0018183 [Alligator mississippiensis]